MTAVFTDDVIVLTGTVPDEASAERVVDLARRYRLTTATIVDDLTVDPDTPTDGGVRVVEHNSVHFVGDTDVITAEHALQLDRLVELMNAFPSATVHVVGNTDQAGDETRNYVVSQRRAEAVVDYLVTQGIDRLRLSTQPAGESNPLIADTSAAAAALNRRTDYVIFGLLDD